MSTKRKYFIFFVFALLSISAQPFYEGLTQKELLKSSSAGDCRIVNQSFAIKNGYDIYFLDKHGNKSSYRHVVAVDPDTEIVYDLSNDYAKQPLRIDKEKYLRDKSFYPYLIISTKNGDNKYQYMEREDKGKNCFTALLNRFYFLVFKAVGNF